MPSGSPRNGCLFLLTVGGCLFLLAVGSAEDDAGSSDGEECAVFDDAALSVAQNFVIHEGSGVAWSVA